MRDDQGAAYRRARADVCAEVMSELDTLSDLPSLSSEGAQLTLQVVRERFEARFPVEDEEEE